MIDPSYSLMLWPGGCRLLQTPSLFHTATRLLQITFHSPRVRIDCDWIQSQSSFGNPAVGTPRSDSAIVVLDKTTSKSTSCQLL